MKEIKITEIRFEGSLTEREIPSFRGAIMTLAGNDSLYHNHTEDAGFQFRYPLIQYKVLDGMPAVVGLEEGADSLGALFRMGTSFDLQIGRESRNFVVKDKSSCYFLADENASGKYKYMIRSWMPFNRENYNEWKEEDGLARKISLLDAILRGNILSLYKGLGVFFEREIHAAILEMEQRSVTYKRVKMVAFDVLIQTDIALPEHLGIGKGVSHGFGVVEKLLPV